MIKVMIMMMYHNAKKRDRVFTLFKMLHAFEN